MPARGEILVELKGVHVDHYGSRLLRGVSWELRRGENWAVLGANGAGKTSLLRLVAGDLWPHFDAGGRRVYHLGPEPSESPVGARRHIAFLCAEHQERYRRHRWDMTGREVILTGLTGTPWFQGAPTPEQAAAAADIIDRLALGGLAAQSILTMSTGQARRVLLGRALVGRPDVLLLDEYLNGLDTGSRATISRMIDGAAAEGVTLVMTSHREEELSPALTHIARMEGGRIIGREARARDTPFPGSTRHLHGQGSPPGTERPSGAASVPLIEVEQCDVVIAGTPILRGINWTLREGECWAVTGANGSGKSTFLALLSGERPPHLGGHVRWKGREEGVSAAERHRLMGIAGPALQAAYRPDVPAEEVILSGFFGSVGLHGDIRPGQRNRARELLAGFGLEHLRRAPFGSLSHGERRRLLLARALVHRPPILLLDEPCDGLDAASRDAFFAAMERAAAGGAAIVHTTHHPSEVLPRTNRLLRLDGGRIARVDLHDVKSDSRGLVACHG